MKQTIYFFALILSVAEIIGCTLSPKRTSQDVIEDSNITGRIKEKLANDSALTLFRINVETRQGVVTLTGNVPTDDRRKKAGDLAATVTGVKAVENLVEVGQKKRAEIFEDAVITSKITSGLIQNPLTHALMIDVETMKGKVILTGRVKSESEKMEAERIARRTEGVVSVENQLKIEVN